MTVRPPPPPYTLLSGSKVRQAGLHRSIQNQRLLMNRNPLKYARYKNQRLVKSSAAVLSNFVGYIYGNISVLRCSDTYMEIFPFLEGN